MRMKMVLACAVMSACCAMGHAQMGAAGPKAAVGSPADPAKEIDGMLSMYEEELTGAAKAMPADKYAFAPSASTFAAGQGAKFDTVRSFAGQIEHLIDANYYFYGTVGGMKPDVDLKALSKLTKKEDLLAALAASFVFAHKAVATITPANAFLVIKGADGMNTRATLATFGVAHGFDHYGQIVEYLRMNGTIPPASAK
jgi:uncharacterized damage-inducible protein DinB